MTVSGPRDACDLAMTRPDEHIIGDSLLGYHHPGGLFSDKGFAAAEPERSEGARGRTTENGTLVQIGRCPGDLVPVTDATDRHVALRVATTVIRISIARGLTRQARPDTRLGRSLRMARYTPTAMTSHRV